MSPLGELPDSTTIAGYTIEGVLGRGGMGIVYRTRHPERKQPVALKLIAPGSAWDEPARERFQREARLAGAVSHRHILPVYETGEEDGVLFVAMKCVEGPDLGARLREGRLAAAHTVSVVSQIASALDAAHAHGLVHRDIKPQNVLLEEDEDGEHAYLADFGVTRAAFSGDPTSPGDMVGTVGYASPEQIRGEPVDRRSDVYALGCLLFECLTGHVPFERADTIATLWAHLHDEPPAPSALLPELPPGFDDVIRRALAKTPDARFGSAGALAKAAGEAVGARAAAEEQPTPRPAEALPTGTVTFLFADVERSTRLLHELGAEGYGEVLEEHRRVLRESFAAHDGVEVDTQGDAFFAAFASAEAALACAGEAQAGLMAGPVRVRIGVHTGEPHLTSEGYVGVDVHRAARIAAAGHGGQVVVSEATADQVEEGFSLLQLGAHRLKDFDEPVGLFQLGDGEFPTLKTIANTNLPTSASSFLGREAELTEGDNLLRATRLLTVTGPGGAGKTRFALEVARRAREERFSDYPDGVFACFLAALRDPALVLPTLCQTLNVREQPGLTAHEALTSHLEGKRMLLLVDNLEHVLAAAPELSRLLARAEGLTLLVTSRELLRLQGEADYQLPPLAADEGVQLFCERARLEPADTIRELCRRLDGLPLAIELAAARTRLLTPDQLLDRLGQRLDLLKAGRDADPRQQTLRTTIEWSYDLLAPQEQQLFARLSVFAGGCTLDAAEDIADADLDTLESLLDKNLIRHTDNRFWMLETIRDYAAEQLLGSGADESLRRRHAGFFLEVAEEIERHLGPGEEAEWVSVGEREIDNIRAAAQWSLEADNPELAFRFVDATWRLSLYRGREREALRFAQDALARGKDSQSFERARALSVGGEVARFQGDLAQARRWKEEAVELLSQTAEPEERGTLAATLTDLGDVFARMGDLGRAREVQEEALALRQSHGEPGGIAHALAGLGETAFLAGDLERARGLLQDVVAIHESLGPNSWRAAAQHSLAEVVRRQGDLEGAEVLLRESLEVAVAMGGEFQIAECLEGIARVALARGEATQATLLVGSADRRRRESGMVGYAFADEHERLLAECHSELGDDAFAATRAEGESMSIGELLGRS